MTAIDTIVTAGENAARPVVITKGIIDRITAAAALIVLAPLLLIVAMAIKLDSDGPVFFSQPRTGRNGRVFRILKFRSMVDRAGLAQARRGDARVTRVGAFLRRTSIDELPQFINVLRGEMSIVGPRPHAVAHDAYYAARIPGYMNRYAVKPGLTGWAQVNNCRGETDTIEKMMARARHDMDYAAHWTLALDLVIILRTPRALITTQQAY